MANKEQSKTKFHSDNAMSNAWWLSISHRVVNKIFTRTSKSMYFPASYFFTIFSVLKLSMCSLPRSFAHSVPSVCVQHDILRNSHFNQFNYFLYTCSMQGSERFGTQQHSSCLRVINVLLGKICINILKMN